MPEISRFFGIILTMNWDDLVPPHFHARYGEHEASILIATSEVDQGSLPPTARRLVKRWARLHRDEFEVAWRRIRNGETPARIAPLD